MPSESLLAPAQRPYISFLTCASTQHYSTASIRNLSYHQPIFCTAPVLQALARELELLDSRHSSSLVLAIHTPEPSTAASLAATLSNSSLVAEVVPAGSNFGHGRGGRGAAGPVVYFVPTASRLTRRGGDKDRGNAGQQVQGV